MGLFDKQKRIEPRDRIEPTIGNLAEGDTVVSSDREGMRELFSSFPTAAGAVVNDRTALRVSAVYACVRLIAGAIAGLPLPIYERKGESRERAQHDYWWLLNERPCSTFSAAAWLEFATMQVLLRGDAIAYMPRNRAGQITAIIPWPRSKVQIDRLKDGARDPGRLRYSFQADEGYFGADQDDVLHFPGLGFDGCQSMSVIQWGARAGIGIAIKGDEYAGQFFGEGAKPEVALKMPGKMSPGAQEDFRQAWLAKYGAAEGMGARKIPLILTEGIDVKELTMSAEDAQIIQTRQWQVIDIARAFGVPPFMVGETEKQSSFGSGIEHMGLGFVRYTLRPHLRRFQQELNAKLFRTDRYFTEFNVDGLQEGDSKAQAEYFGKALGGPGAQGWMVVNEVRRLKNLPPVEGGDELIVPTSTAEQTEPAPETSNEENTEAAAARA